MADWSTFVTNLETALTLRPEALLAQSYTDPAGNMVTYRSIAEVRAALEFARGQAASQATSTRNRKTTVRFASGGEW